MLPIGSGKNKICNPWRPAPFVPVTAFFIIPCLELKAGPHFPTTPCKAWQAHAESQARSGRRPPVRRLRVLGRVQFEPHLLAFAPGALAAVKGGIPAFKYVMAPFARALHRTVRRLSRQRSPPTAGSCCHRPPRCRIAPAICWGQSLRGLQPGRRRAATSPSTTHCP